MTDIEAVKARLRDQLAITYDLPSYVKVIPEFDTSDVTALLDAHDAAAARIAKLEEALKPFAELGEGMILNGFGVYNAWTTCADSAPVGNIGPYGFTFGHFRRAAAALEEK